MEFSSRHSTSGGQPNISERASAIRVCSNTTLGWPSRRKRAQVGEGFLGQLFLVTLEDQVERRELGRAHRFQ